MEESRFGDLINGVFANNQGLVIGEYHASFASLNFLIAHAPLFKKFGVKYIFTEKFFPADDEGLKYYYTGAFNDTHIVAYLKDALSAFPQRGDLANAAKNKLLEFLNAMRSNNIQVIGINNKDINNKHNVNKPEGRADSATEMNPFMANVVARKICKQDKFLVLAGAAHASLYTTWNGDKINGISEELNKENIFCESFHVYEQNFFTNIPPHDTFCNEAKYKLGDMQDNEELCADRLIVYGKNDELFMAPIKINLESIDTSRKNQPHNSRTNSSQTFNFNLNENLDSEPIISNSDSDPILPFRESNENCNIM